MIKKNEKFRNRKNVFNRTIFLVLLLLYLAGVFIGCSFAIKNSHNLDFVKSVTLTSNLSETLNPVDFSRYRLFFIRDILCIISIITLKNSGVLKGLCVCVPFIAAVQNGSICISDYRTGTGVYEIITGYCLRNTASAFMIIIYCTVIVQYIITGREDRKEELRKTVVYISGILLIYILDYTIKNMFR